MNWIKIIKVILINILIFIILIFLLEVLFWSARKVLDRPDLGFMRTDNSLLNSDACRRMKTHPVLSHSHDTRGECMVRDGIPGDHFVFYEHTSNQPAVVTLGGSTTSGFYQHFSDGFTWPLFLHNMVSQKGYQVINGGVGAYSSSQELLKLITEVRRLKDVKLIVSLNGINDTPNYPGGHVADINTRYPFLTQLQYRMIQSSIWVDQRINREWFPNIRDAARRGSDAWRKFSTPETKTLEKNLSQVVNSTKFKSISAAERWQINVESMHAISTSMGVQYMVFLQPTMGLYGAQSNLSSNTESEDAKMLKSLKNNKQAYISEINSLYNELKIRCSRLDYCIDISSVAPPTGNMYSNPRHHNKNGNKIIAKEIFKNISL